MEELKIAPATNQKVALSPNTVPALQSQAKITKYYWQGGHFQTQSKGHFQTQSSLDSIFTGTDIILGLRKPRVISKHKQQQRVMFKHNAKTQGSFSNTSIPSAGRDSIFRTLNGMFAFGFDPQPILSLPQKVTSQDHQILQLPRKVRSQDPEMLHLPRKVLFIPLLDCSFAVPFLTWLFLCLCRSFPYLTVP